MDVGLFQGFSNRILKGAGTEVFARIGGQGFPLLLIHGYPETHVCWHKVAPQLAKHYTVVACDLRGYGASGMPKEILSTTFSKRDMAMDLVAAMEEIGFSRFFVAGHDRGARVAYRLALDHPQKVAGLAIMSILPTFTMWLRLQKNEYAMKAFRWFLLAQPPPFPEELIKAAGLKYLHSTLSSWTKKNDLSAFDSRALAAYESAYTNNSTIVASCGDYRAGWTTDRFHDQADISIGKKIDCPMLVLWGNAEFSDKEEMLKAWRQLASNVTGQSLECGHFAPEEAPEEVYEALRDFLRQIKTDCF